MVSKVVLTKRLSEVHEKKHELGIKIGRMNITPRSDPSYSGSKLSNWMQELKELEDKESEIQGELLTLDGGTVEVGTPAPSKVEPAPEAPDPDLETATRKAEKEITRLLDQSNNRAIEIAREIYKLTDLLKEQEKDWNLAGAAVHVNPDKLSAWQVREAFPVGDLLNFMIITQRRIGFVHRDLLEKAVLPMVW
jgi:hypothetical protein